MSGELVIMEYKSQNIEQTEQIACKFAKQLNKGDVVALFGGLGAGKTAFVRGLARGLGIDEYINSPTFVILNEYQGRLPLYHFDMYRILDGEALYDIGYYDYIDADGICAIEWSENILNYLPKQYYQVELLRQQDTQLENADCRLVRIQRIGG